MHWTIAAKRGLPLLVCASLAACGGGSNGASAPLAVPTPNNGTVAVTATGAVPVAAPVNDVATIGLPASTTIPAGETVTAIASTSAPSGVAAFDTARAAQSVRTTQLAGASPLVFMTLTPSVAITLVPGTTATFAAPGLTVANGQSVYAAVLDTGNGAGWLYNPSAVTCTFATAASGLGTATCTTSQGYALVGGRQYVVAIFAQPTIADTALPAGGSFAQKSTFNATYVAGPGLVGALPQNVVNSVATETTTIAAGQTFNGTTGLYGALSSIPAPAGSAYSAYTNTGNTYEQFDPIAGGTQLDIYGFANAQSYTLGTTAYTFTSTQIDTTPFIVQRFPDVAGTSYAEPTAQKITAASKTTIGGSLSSSFAETETIAADGSINDTYSYGDATGATTATYTTVTTASPITAMQTQSGPGTTNSFVQIGAPVLNASGSYVIPYLTAPIANGSPQPAPTATTVPLWYPNGPTTPLAKWSRTQNGPQALPAACGTLPANVGTTFTETDETFQNLDPTGSYSTFQYKIFTSPVGQVCTLETGSQTFVNVMTGAIIDTGSITNVIVVTAYTPPTATSSASRSAAAVGNVAPITLVPDGMQPRLRGSVAPH